MALPTFFIIGAAKTGTTSLHYYLDQHPQIQMSPTKEPHFFIEAENLPSYLANRVDNLKEYEELFDSNSDVRGEASPSYTEYPKHKGAPERIVELVPDAKFIYLVRDPVDRTVSHYMHGVAMDGERRSLQEALSDLSDPQSSPYTSPSLYAMQLDRYLRHFPRDRVLVIDQAELLADRRATLREIFAFLSVDDTFDSPRFEEKLGTSGERRVYPSRYLHLAKRITASPLRRLPRGARRSLRRVTERALWPALETPTLDEDLRTELQKLYAGEVERLRALTGRTFSTWSV
jgi:hypothetical protein